MSYEDAIQVAIRDGAVSLITVPSTDVPLARVSFVASIENPQTVYHNVLLVADVDDEDEQDSVTEIITNVPGFDKYCNIATIDIDTFTVVVYGTPESKGSYAVEKAINDFQDWFEGGMGPTPVVILNETFGLCILNDDGGETKLFTPWTRANPDTWCSDTEDYSDYGWDDTDDSDDTLEEIYGKEE